MGTKPQCQACIVFTASFSCTEACRWPERFLLCQPPPWRTAAIYESSPARKLCFWPLPVWRLHKASVQLLKALPGC